ncbi:addiction module toxin RelE [Mucilaginibacter psychrotolerans]|uniref:addiction module toxin RelE n=1 Tax=Mucilaginibacter psychrotolerans TaxID=1524096 RepID=UPI00186464C4|nr:addiction module toxin RelE [Mucilaginibacter psychrotolerans]
MKPLAKKYKTLKESVLSLESALIENPHLGEPYGEGIYKVRWSDPSKGKGKSGGFRVMYYLLRQTEGGTEILLLTIFDKSEVETIKKKAAVKLKDDVLSSMGLKKPTNN